MSENPKVQAKHKVWENSEKIAHLYTQEFMSAHQIAKSFDCPQSVIREVLRSMGVSLKTGGE